MVPQFTFAKRHSAISVGRTGHRAAAGSTPRARQGGLRVLAGCLLLCAAAGQQAEAQAGVVSLASDAMPGVDTVPVLGAEKGLIDLSGNLDYGFTESVLDKGDRHHRVALRAAGAISPVRFLTLGIQFGGQYDGHYGGPADNNDSGLQLRPRFVLRGETEVEDGLHLGLQGTMLPAPTWSVGDALTGAGLRLDALAGTQQGALSLNGRFGLGLDGGRKATNADTLSFGDRLALAISDAPEVRLGVGGIYALSDDLALVSELTWDIPVGKNAVAAVSAPIWLRLGARLPISRSLQMGAIIGISPSSRPTLTETGPLVRLDPRATVGISIAGRALREEFEPASPPVVEQDLGLSALSLLVRGYQGAPLSGARVRSEAGTCETNSAGRCTPEPRATAATEVTIEAEGYEPQTVVSTPNASEHTLEVALVPLPVQLRGRVLDDAGNPRVGATVTVLRDDHQLESTTDAEGNFALAAMSPGPAIVRIEAEGITAEEREILLEPGSEPLELATHDEANAGQIRGTVRSFDGTPIEATILIQPNRRSLKSNALGEFSVDVPAGKYTVTVQADGFRQQRRETVVESHGVTVILIDLGTAP